MNKGVTDETGEYWRFRKFLGIQHIPPKQKDRLGTKYNVKMLWETSKITYEPLDFLAKDIPVEFLTCHTHFKQAIDHRNYICYLGAHLHEISFA